MTNKIGVLLTTCNQKDKLEAAFNSFIECKENVERYLFVLDNDSKDKTVEFLLNKFIDIQNKFSFESIAHNNLCKALNYGVKKLLDWNDEIDAICWLHTDMIFFLNYWLTNLYENFKSHEDWWKVHPMSLHAIAGEQWKDFVYFIQNYEEAKKIAKDYIDQKYEAYVGNDCPILVRASVFKDNNIWWDENIIGMGADFDDLDFNNQIIKAGGKVVCCRNSIVWHEGMGFRVTVEKQEHYRNQLKNRAYYFDKWRLQDSYDIMKQSEKIVPES